MVQLSEMELKTLIRGGETNTVELKVAAPRATEMAERFCGMANARDGIIIYQRLPNPKSLISYPIVNYRF
jgi:hypothetical protein